MRMRMHHLFCPIIWGLRANRVIQAIENPTYTEPNKLKAFFYDFPNTPGDCFYGILDTFEGPLYKLTSRLFEGQDTTYEHDERYQQNFSDIDYALLEITFRIFTFALVRFKPWKVISIAHYI